MTSYPAKRVFSEIIVVDLDGTLSDASYRAKQYLQQEHKDWDAFYKSCGTDAPIKPLTYLFLWELPKFKRALAKDGYALKPLKSFSEVIGYLETNFASKEDIEQYYRDNAPIDFDDRGIGAYHGD